MRFYTIQHTFYCGIDLHVDWMYLCVLDADGELLLYRHSRTAPKALLLAVKPFREAEVVGVECMVPWDLDCRPV
jgi:hypothetical protein